MPAGSAGRYMVVETAPIPDGHFLLARANASRVQPAMGLFKQSPILRRCDRCR